VDGGLNKAVLELDPVIAAVAVLAVSAPPHLLRPSRATPTLPPGLESNHEVFIEYQ
jgi:hypothetical protein